MTQLKTVSKTTFFETNFNLLDIAYYVSAKKYRYRDRL
jgi:hypothetical protein